MAKNTEIKTDVKEEALIFENELDISNEEVNLPIVAAEEMDWEEDSGAGTEGADKSSFAIPFISILQALSPQVAGETPMEGAKAGKFFNNITNEIFDHVEFIPCAFQRRFIRWAANRGGFKGDHSPIDVETGRLVGMSEHGGRYLMDVPAGQPVFDASGRPLYDELSDTRNHFVLYKTVTGSWQPAIISLSSTQIKKSKRLMSLVTGVEVINKAGKAYNPPSFSHVYVAKPTFEKNAKGSWWGFEFSVVRPLQGHEVDLYAKAKAFNKSVIDGVVKAEPPLDGSDYAGAASNVDPETGEVKF